MMRQFTLVSHSCLLVLCFPLGFAPSSVLGQVETRAKSTNRELAQRVRQSIFSAQRQLPLLEQDLARSEANLSEANRELETHKKEVAVLTQAIGDLKAAQTKSTEALGALETQVKQQSDRLKQLKDEIAPDPASDKAKPGKQKGLEKASADARKNAEELRPKVAALDQALAFNQTRRSELIQWIGQHDAKLRAQREAELQSSQQVEEIKTTRSKLVAELDRLEKLAAEQKTSLQKALEDAQAAATGARDQAGKFRELVNNSPTGDATRLTAQQPAGDSIASPANDKPVAAANSSEAESTKANADMPADSASDALTGYQLQMGKLIDSYQRTAQLMSTAQVTLQQLFATRSGLAAEEARLSEASKSNEQFQKLTVAAKEKLSEAEKEMETLTQAITSLRDKHAEVKLAADQAFASVAAAEKELGEFLQAQAAPLSQAEQLLLKSKSDAVGTAENDLAQLKQELQAKTDRVRQLNIAVNFNQQALEAAKWYEQVATQVVEVRKLEQATASTNSASAKAALESLTTALQKLDADS